MQIFPSCVQIDHLDAAPQTQALTASKPSELSRAAECHLDREARDTDAANQEPSDDVRGTVSILASNICELPSTSKQLSESVQRQLSEASWQEVSSPPALGVVDSALFQLSPSTLDQSINTQWSSSVHSQLSVVNRTAARSPAADTVTKPASLSSSASDAAWQYHGCNRSGQTGNEAQEHDVHRAGLPKLASKEGLDGSSNAVSACNIASSRSSESSSAACSKTSITTCCSEASHSSSSSSDDSSSKGCSKTACSEGQASSVPSGSAVALSRSVEDCKAALLWTNKAEDNKQLPTSVLLAGSKREVPALAPSNESVMVDSSAADDVHTSTASSSASADVPAGPTVPQDTSDSIASSSEAVQTVFSRVKRAESSLSASTSSTEARPASRGLDASAPAAGQGDFRGGGQHDMLLSAREVLIEEGMHACPQLTTSTGVRQAGEAAQLSIVPGGHGVSMMGLLPEAKVQAAGTAEVCDVQTELADTGMQTDVSMLACQLQAETKSCCSAPISGVRVKADSQFTEPAESVIASDSGLVSGSAAKTDAARHQSLHDGPAGESACNTYVSGDGLSSSGADAEGPTMHSSKVGGTAVVLGEAFMSSVDANQNGNMCAQTGMQKIGKTDRVQDGNAHMSDCQQNMPMQQVQPAMLGLVTACGGHDSLKELIRADMSCFWYEKDYLLMSVVEKIRDTLTFDST